MSRSVQKPLVLRMADAIASFIGFAGEQSTPRPLTSAAMPQRDVRRERPALHLVQSETSAEEPGDHKWRRHPQLRAYAAPITPDAREARRYAVRGLYAAREGALEIATDLFTQAARCRDIELTEIPGFWDLTRGQMQAAIDGYENAERYREAAALDAQIATTFRPSVVGSRPAPIAPRMRKQTAGTN